MAKKTHYDVVVAGGGLAGLTLSALLGRQGLKILCLDKAPAADLSCRDLRTTAISYGSKKILEEAGIWQNLADNLICPINDIHILDGHSPLLLRFLSGEVENKSFGWIVENTALRAAMAQAVKAQKTVTYRTGTGVTGFTVEDDLVSVKPDKGAEVSAALVAGADGRQSFVRDWMGVRTRTWNYRQRAVICTVIHENPHHNTAVEHFWPSGPFAILPMSDDETGRHCSSVVFTEHGPEQRSLMHMDDKSFEMALANRFPESYGSVKLAGKRACYPLSLVHAAEYISPRMALVADAAHGIHPIAGQGLNLGFRDVKALADLVSAAHEAGQDVGAAGLLETYQRQRRFDNMSMVAVTDGLVRLFSNNIPPVRLLRRAGLKIVSKLPPAKQFFMRRAMGDSDG